MKKHFLYFISLIILLIFVESCSTTAQLYDDKNRSYTGLLRDSTFTVLKQYLTNTTNLKLKDTIIIKYNYNNETCWNILDQKEDSYIMSFVTGYKERVQRRVLAARQNVSVFNFREPGNKLNKIIKWDNSILIDSSKQLFNLLFKERCICGSSIIALPDKRFIFLRSDSHTDVLNLTQKQIEEILNKKSKRSRTL
ncbi:MAG: hypothetical protein JST07_06450 [Bacteroidetes bacterium]|nr:hypothetical protein [Bacteroidota bacterium]